MTDTVLITLTQGFRAIVDASDAPALLLHTWSARRCRGVVYAVRPVRRPDGEWRVAYMHRDILGAGDGAIVDHLDGDGMNNRRANLRFCTRSQNQFNRAGSAGTSAYKGVSWHAAGNKWQAHINAAGRKHYLGLFATEAEAARAYDAKAQQLHGAFARLNFPAEAA